MQRGKLRSRTGLVPLLVSTTLLLGCGGGSGVERVTVSGTVAFKRQPVPAGFVCFTPDTKKGNHGPQGYAKIVDGRYNTADGGKGSVSGPQVVEIRGFDGKASGDLAAIMPGRRLFPSYRTEVDIPARSTTLDFQIPDDSEAVNQQ